MSEMSRPRWRRGASLAVLAVLSLVASACGGAGGGGGGGGGGGNTITVAMVANPQMQDLDKVGAEFKKVASDITVNFVVLPENEVRDGYTGQGNWDANDILPSIKEALTYQGALYAAPFYGESSFLMYRKDLFQQAGLTMPDNPTWDQVAQFAAKLNNPAKKMAGICLRGLPGWGEVLAPLNTVILTFGGRWYDEDWNAHLTDPETKEATQFYVDTVRKYGEPGAPNAGFSECLTAMGQGNAAMWYDATVGAGSLEDPSTSKVAGKMGYVPAPVVKTQNAGWLWAWSLAIPNTSKNKDAAWDFVSWATSKGYLNLVGQKLGWARVPPGSRLSTYQIPEYKEAAAAFADQTLASIQAVNVKQPGLYPQPWVGVQYVAIPEFQDLGTKVAQEITAAIAGRQSVDDALAKAQKYAEQTAKDGGYKK